MKGVQQQSLRNFGLVLVVGCGGEFSFGGKGGQLKFFRLENIFAAGDP
jgi:hypothetical protein